MSQSFSTNYLLLWNNPSSSLHLDTSSSSFRFYFTWHFLKTFSLSVQLSSIVQSCPTLCDTMDYSTASFPVHYKLLELAQIQVLWVSDAIQPSHPLFSPSPPLFNLSQHQGLFQWVSYLHQVANVLELQLQHQPFQIFRTDFLDWLVGSLFSPRDSQESSEPQFKSISSLVVSFLYGPTLT